MLVAVPSTSDPEGLWQKVLAATAIDDLLAELASLGLDETLTWRCSSGPTVSCVP